MYGYVLQDWITVKGTNNNVFNQSESDWLGFSSFQDIAFWVDVREVAVAGIVMNFQTCPTKDDVLFQTMTGCSITINTVPQTPFLIGGTTLPRVILASNPGIPLSTWVRWQLAPPNSNWDITFRVLASANRVMNPAWGG